MSIYHMEEAHANLHPQILVSVVSEELSSGWELTDDQKWEGTRLLKKTVQLDFIFSLLCQVAQIVKWEMEAAVKLYVKLRAKVQVGPSWGNLQELDI